MFKEKSTEISLYKNFGHLLNLTSRYFAFLGGIALLIAALISIFSIFGRVVFSSPIILN
jgi:TRAP-type C4-dicarboxylate transport system permease small subunit